MDAFHIEPNTRRGDCAMAQLRQPAPLKVSRARQPRGAEYSATHRAYFQVTRIQPRGNEVSQSYSCSLLGISVDWRKIFHTAPQGEPHMKNAIYWVCVFKIDPTRFEDFKALVHPLIEKTKTENGSMAYEYHVNADHTEIHIIEHYRDSEAVVHHVTQTFAGFAEAFTQLATVSSFTVYGAPTPQARAILDGFGAVYVTPFDGFTK
jgi:quinol monooxygenase YgiN